MAGSSGAETREPEYDRNAELRAFDETKAGVKGLVDAGVTEVPRMFIFPKGHLQDNSNSCDKGSVPEIPIIDLDGIKTRRGEIADKVRDASEKFGCFQVLNHGVPGSVQEELFAGVRRFFEQDDELKKPWYTRDLSKKVVYNSNMDLYSKPAIDWRDSLLCIMGPNTPAPEDLPDACSAIVIKYTKEVKKVGYLLFELLSEGLGLEPNYIREKGEVEGLPVICHYYPACPQPELTMGATNHSDSPFITVVLQDQVSGFQILHQNQWIDAPLVPGALFVNVGDHLQYKSVEHRVLANRVGPRISVPAFFTTKSRPTGVHKPINQEVPEEKKPKLDGISVEDVTDYYKKKKKEEELEALLPPSSFSSPMDA